MKFLPWFKHTEAGYRNVRQPVAPVLFFFLPSLNCRSGTSRVANHNTVGTAFALPSLRCTQTLFRVFLLSFLIICLFWLFFSFPNGNFEVDWCCLFRANSSKHKG